MKYLMMDWFGNFKCIGGECPATCCGGWGILVDDATRKKYEELREKEPEFFSEYVCNEDGSIQLIHEKCPLLTEDGWCSVVNKYGEEMLCDTCKVYPREVKTYGDVNECTVKISCPVVAEYLLSGKEISFLYSEDEKKEEKEYDYVVYDAFSHARRLIVELLQEKRQYPLIGRLFCMLDIDYKLEQLYQSREITMEKVDTLLGVLSDAEYLGGVCSQVMELHTNIDIKRKSIVELFQILFGENEIVIDSVTDGELKLYLQSVEREPEIFCQDYREFSKFCAEYERVYENYFIYQHFLHILPEKEKTLVWRMAILEFCYIQMLAMITFRKERTLDKTKYREIIVKVARRFEHNDKKSEQRNQMIKENGFKDIAHLWMCLLV